MQSWACRWGDGLEMEQQDWLQMVTVLTNSVPNSLIMVPSPVPFRPNEPVPVLGPQTESIQISNSGGQERGQSQTVGGAVTATITGQTWGWWGGVGASLSCSREVVVAAGKQRQRCKNGGGERVGG